MVSHGGLCTSATMSVFLLVYINLCYVNIQECLFLWVFEDFYEQKNNCCITHHTHVSVDHELHTFLQKLLLVINPSYAKLWLMAAGLMRLQVSRWDDCKIESFCLMSGPVCVTLGKSPATQPLPRCSSHHANQTETNMHSILTHKHTNTGFTQLLHLQSRVLCSMLY